MTINSKAEGTNFGSKTIDYFTDNQETFSVPNSNTEAEQAGATITFEKLPRLLTGRRSRPMLRLFLIPAAGGSMLRSYRRS